MHLLNSAGQLTPARKRLHPLIWCAHSYANVAVEGDAVHAPKVPKIWEDIAKAIDTEPNMTKIWVVKNLKLATQVEVEMITRRMGRSQEFEGADFGAGDFHLTFELLKVRSVGWKVAPQEGTLSPTLPGCAFRQVSLVTRRFWFCSVLRDVGFGSRLHPYYPKYLWISVAIVSTKGCSPKNINMKDGNNSTSETTRHIHIVTSWTWRCWCHELDPTSLLSLTDCRQLHHVELNSNGHWQLNMHVRVLITQKYLVTFRHVQTLRFFCLLVSKF